MAAPLDRTWYNTLIDDDGSGQTGTIWNKAQVNVFMNTIDASLAGLVDKVGGTPVAGQLAVFNDADTIRGESRLTLPNGQIQFPLTQNPTGDATTLDDYREIITTTRLVGLGGQSGQTYNIQQLGYIKIGRLFIGSGRISVATLGTISGEVGLELPFASWALWTSGALSLQNVTGLATPVTSLFGNVPGGWNLCTLRKFPAGGAQQGQYVYQSDLTDAFTIDFSISYLTQD